MPPRNNFTGSLQRQKNMSMKVVYWEFGCIKIQLVYAERAGEKQTDIKGMA